MCCTIGVRPTTYLYPFPCSSQNAGRHPALVHFLMPFDGDYSTAVRSPSPACPLFCPRRLTTPTSAPVLPPPLRLAVLRKSQAGFQTPSSAPNLIYASYLAFLHSRCSHYPSELLLLRPRKPRLPSPTPTSMQSQRIVRLRSNLSFISLNLSRVAPSLPLLHYSIL